jgi:hypothetical protein
MEQLALSAMTHSQIDTAPAHDDLSMVIPLAHDSCQDKSSHVCLTWLLPRGNADAQQHRGDTTQSAG